jgi:hypothetical protein
VSSIRVADIVEVCALRLPVHEVRVEYLDAWEARQLALRDGGELLAEFDAGDRVAALDERQRRLPRAAPISMRRAFAGSCASAARSSRICGG